METYDSPFLSKKPSYFFCRKPKKQDLGKPKHRLNPRGENFPTLHNGKRQVTIDTPDQFDSNKLLLDFRVPTKHYKSASVIPEGTKSTLKRMDLDSLNEIMRSCDFLHKNLNRIKSTTPVHLKEALEGIKQEYLICRHGLNTQKYFKKVNDMLCFQKEAVAKARREIDDNSYFVSKQGGRKVWKFKSKALSKKQEEDIRVFENNIY